MFDNKSDYALNKKKADVIVYKTVNGSIFLTREDFDSEKEFQKWKTWSDANYHNTERQNRKLEDQLELNEYIEATAVLLEFLDTARESGVSNQVLQINKFQLAYQYGKRTLTKTQRRRLMLFAHGMKVTEIAQAEGVKKQSVSESLASAKCKLIRFVKKLSTIHENTLTKP